MGLGASWVKGTRRLSRVLGNNMYVCTRWLSAHVRNAGNPRLSM